MSHSSPEAIDLGSCMVVASNQITSQLGDESVILGLDDGMYYGLDAIGTRVWALMEQPRLVRDICDVIQQEYDVQPAECEEAVLALLRDLEAKALIERRQ